MVAPDYRPVPYKRIYVFQTTVAEVRGQSQHWDQRTKTHTYIMKRTPGKHWGEPTDLRGALILLASPSPATEFVTVTSIALYGLCLQFNQIGFTWAIFFSSALVLDFSQQYSWPVCYFKNGRAPLYPSDCSKPRNSPDITASYTQ